MRAFADLGVKLERRFEGERIRIEKIEGDPIVVLDFEIRQSKLKRENDPHWDGSKGECVYLQIESSGQKRVLWGNYKFLIEQLKQVPAGALPFKATIVNEHGYVLKEKKAPDYFGAFFITFARMNLHRWTFEGRLTPSSLVCSFLA